MKKIYSLLFLVIASVSFGQTVYTENMGTTPSGNPVITAYSGWQNGAPIVYTGTADVRTSAASAGYIGASGSGNIFITNSAGRYFQIDGINTSAYSTANLQLSFGLNATAAVQPIVEVSTNASATTPTWTPLTYTNVSGWQLITITSGIPSSTTLSLRFSQATGTMAQLRIDDVKVFNLNASCTLVLQAPTTSCNATTYGLDTYTASINYTGGGSGTYTITPSSGTVAGDNPGSVAGGTILINGVTEGTNLTVDITSTGSCSYQATVNAPECKPVNDLPFIEPFTYAEASNLAQSQKWSNITTGGDEVIVAGGTITPAYPGITPSGGYAIFEGTGNDTSTAFVPQTSGTVYYSFILNVGSMATVTDTNGGYFAALASGSTNFGATLWAKKVDDGMFNLGIEVRTGNAANTTWTSTAYASSSTYFVVVGYTFGPDASDDTVSLWVNPAFNTAQPAALITDTHTGTDMTSIGNFVLRQDSATETPFVAIDELRIATNWAYVTSSTLGTSNNNISGLKMYPNPVSNGTLFIETTANGEKDVKVYDVLGKMVLNTTTSDSSVNVSSLHTGVYIVNITEEGKTASRKLVIK